MAKTRRLANDLSLPPNMVTQKFAFIGRSSSGKTYASSKLVELLLEEKAQVVVVDPVGVWWGLRIGANGKSLGFDVPIFGGSHGDIPLEATAGKLVADLVVEKTLSLILDVSDFTGGEVRRFVADFATELLHRKKRARSPLMVVWEECQEVVPQRVFADAAKMVGAVERLTKQGRNFGIGTTLISQRPQAVNKDVLNQTEVLVVFQTTGPQERKAIEGWVVSHGLDVSRVVDELPALPQGTGYIWSPQWLRVMQKIRVLPKRTYDASATPTFDTRSTVEPGAINLQDVRTAMQATIDLANQNDPTHLRQQIAALERQITKRLPGASHSEPEKIVIAPLDSKALARVERASEAIKSVAATLRAATDAFLDAAPRLQREMKDLVDRIQFAFSGQAPRKATVKPGTRAVGGEAQTPNKPTATFPALSHDGKRKLTSAERQVLKVLSQYPVGCRRGKLALLCGYRYSGGFRNALSTLRTAGLMIGSNQGVMQITDAGIQALGDHHEPLPSGAALLDLWLQDKRLSRAARQVLQMLVEVYPRGLAGPELAVRVGQAYSGGFRNALSQLRTAGLIEGMNVSPMTVSAHLIDIREDAV